MYMRRTVTVTAATPVFAPSPTTAPRHARTRRAHRDDPGAPRPLPLDSPRVSVVIPARNEAANLPPLLAELPAGLHEVILVDGDSTDDTVRTARRARPGITVLHQTGHGKGNALACGILACTGDVVITLDADGSADPAEIKDFVAALVDGADYAKGSRVLPGGGSADLTLLRRTGNAALVFLMNRVYHTRFSDLCYGYNAFWTRCVDALALAPIAEAEPAFGDGFEIETLLAAHAATAHLAIAEVASYERVRRTGESNLRTFRDGQRVLKAIVRERRTNHEHRDRALDTVPALEGPAETP
ncbi:MAG TPA: glycosyltransferase family 2 protein [Actinospica sp.]|jgi:glycosyltransferase involved in cell wall biosynthesis|nr:glycosyltransferase family 2 protein [Actinospica sp.]